MTQTKELLTGLSIVSDTKQSQANTVFIKVADVLSIERHKSRVHIASRPGVQMTMNPLYCNMIRAWNFKKVRVICLDTKWVSDAKDLILGGHFTEERYYFPNFLWCWNAWIMSKRFSILNQNHRISSNRFICFWIVRHPDRLKTE